LPHFVSPAITVAQIMSGLPQLLSPDTPVEEAAERMRRFGDFPVVQDGQWSACSPGAVDILHQDQRPPPA
jgi:hypothetical protein